MARPAASSKAHAWLAAMLAAGLGAAWTLIHFPPGLYHFYPACPIHHFTGLLCPGCGATRALALLLQGHPGRALEQNALVVLLLPWLAGYLAVAYLRCSAGKPWPRLPEPAIMTLLAVALLFGVYRNLA